MSNLYHLQFPALPISPLSDPSANCDTLEFAVDWPSGLQYKLWLRNCSVAHLPRNNL
jgi:hypothetical protein